MLVLSRRIGENIIINEDITVSILSVHGHQVRLGIKAPRDVPVHREEIHQRLVNERQQQAYENGNYESMEKGMLSFNQDKPSPKRVPVVKKRTNFLRSGTYDNTPKQ